MLLFLARVLIAVGMAWPNHFAAFESCICLAVCDHRGRLYECFSFLFWVISSTIFLFSFSPSLDAAQTQGHKAGSSLHSACLHFCHENTSALSSLVDSIELRLPTLQGALSS